tara:strand:+ start:175226 stop:175444 length:219 start_codon:yes stop_codon:yes gene_type:complete
MFSFRNLPLSNQKGQIVVEYVLLLVVLLSLALVIVDMSIDRAPGDEGFVIKVWMDIVETISADYPDTVDGAE